MLDAVRGWRKERVLWTTDSSGVPVPVTTGLTTDVKDEEVVGLAIGNGPTATVDLDSGSKLVTNLRQSLADWLERRRGA